MSRVTKEMLKTGMLLKQSWGCTMNRVNFFQVVSVKGSKVELGVPKSDFEATGYDAGYAKLVGPNENPLVTAYAKMTRGGLKLCEGPGKVDYNGKDISWKVGDSYWDYLSEVQPGYSEYTYGD